MGTSLRPDLSSRCAAVETSDASMHPFLCHSADRRASARLRPRFGRRAARPNRSRRPRHRPHRAAPRRHPSHQRRPRLGRGRWRSRRCIRQTRRRRGSSWMNSFGSIRRLFAASSNRPRCSTAPTISRHIPGLRRSWRNTRKWHTIRTSSSGNSRGTRDHRAQRAGEWSKTSCRWQV